MELPVPGLSGQLVDVAFPDCLGRHKAVPWIIENETRVLCSTSLFTQDKGWEWLDLHLFEDFFRNMTVILSPWDDGTQRRHIEGLLDETGFQADIRSSITVIDSTLKGTIKQFDNCENSQS